MKDIAAHVGVSTMAVSAVLGQTASRVGVSPATRARIVEAARQLGYRPNALARSLRSSRTNVIGFYSGYHYLDPRNPFLAQILGGVQRGCAEHGKDLLLHTVFRESSVDAIVAALADRRIDGLVMTAPPEDPLAERLAESHLPVVAVADVVPNLPCVVADDAAGSRMVIEHLAERGHRRVVYRSKDELRLSAERRKAVAFDRAAELGLGMAEWKAPELLRDDDSFLRAWQSQRSDERPTAVMCWNDRSAFDVLEHCHRLGISVPVELAVTGFDDIPNPLGYRFRLTTVRAPWAEVARTAVTLLAQRIRGGEIQHQTVLPVELVPGDTA